MTPSDPQDAPEWDSDLEIAVQEMLQALEESEEDLVALEKDIALLRQEIDGFFHSLQDLPDFGADDLVFIFRKLAWQEMRLQTALGRCLQGDEARRESIETLQDGRVKTRLLAMCDRRCILLRSALAACETGKENLLALSRDLLTLEAQRMLLSPYWNDHLH